MRVVQRQLLSDGAAAGHSEDVGVGGRLLSDCWRHDHDPGVISVRGLAVIASAAEAAGLCVLHYDADYDLVAQITGQAVEWVVPAGSVP